MQICHLEFSKISYQLTQKWKETQILVNHISSRLLTQYIPPLHRRSTWNQKVPPITVGELVRVLPDFTPRWVWPLVRVEAVSLGEMDRPECAL